MMFLRKESANLLRRFRFSPQSLPATPIQRNSQILLSNAGKCRFSSQHGSGGYFSDSFQWIFLFGQAAFILGVNVTPALAEEVSPPATTGINAEISNLSKIEDGSVISNIHTSKWRVFTDSGRDLFLQGKLEEAEKLFLSALQEAKEGFGDRDPHVASAHNNLAELYRVKKAFNKAEPMYLEAISILEESFGQDDSWGSPSQSRTVISYAKKTGTSSVYELALKIKRRVLGEAHPDYADTMYHLGTLQSLNTLSLLETTKLEREESKEPYSSEAESALRQCISAYKEFVTEKSLSDAPGVKAEYLLCLKHLVDLLSDNKNTSSTDRSSKPALQELKDEIKHVEIELSKKGGRRS